MILAALFFTMTQFCHIYFNGNTIPQIYTAIGDIRNLLPIVGGWTQEAASADFNISSPFASAIEYTGTDPITVLIIGTASAQQSGGGVDRNIDLFIDNNGTPYDASRFNQTIQDNDNIVSMVSMEIATISNGDFLTVKNQLIAGGTGDILFMNGALIVEELPPEAGAPPAGTSNLYYSKNPPTFAPSSPDDTVYVSNLAVFMQWDGVKWVIADVLHGGIQCDGIPIMPEAKLCDYTADLVKAPQENLVQIEYNNTGILPLNYPYNLVADFAGEKARLIADLTALGYVITEPSAASIKWNQTPDVFERTIYDGPSAGLIFQSNCTI